MWCDFLASGASLVSLTDTGGTRHCQFFVFNNKKVCDLSRVLGVAAIWPDNGALLRYQFLHQ
jgi:hypothetical protein